MDKKKRQQEALVKKQKRSAAMQAMLEDPGFTGVDAAVDVTQEVPAWVMDGGIRCMPVKICMLCACATYLAATCVVPCNCVAQRPQQNYLGRSLHDRGSFLAKRKCMHGLYGFLEGSFAAGLRRIQRR